MNVKSSMKGRIGAWIAGSRWAGVAWKVAAYLAALAALSLIGSGRIAGWLSPPAGLSLGIAAAHAAPPPTASAAPAASAAPSAAPSAPTDARSSAAPSEAGSTAAGVSADGKVILNLATEQDLRRLPGVGPKRAKAILALRERLKKFKRVEDLLKVKGIGRRSLARLRPLVRVD